VVKKSGHKVLGSLAQWWQKKKKKNLGKKKITDVGEINKERRDDHSALWKRKKVK